MQYSSNFIENMNAALQHQDYEGLNDMFAGKIADLIANDKKPLVRSLVESGADIKPSISNGKLSKFIVNGIENKNQNVAAVVATAIVQKHIGGTMNDVGGGLAGAGVGGAAGYRSSSTSDSGRKKVDIDKIGKIVNVVSDGLQGAMGFVKDVQAVKGGKTTTQKVDEGVNYNLGNRGSSATGMSVGKKLGIGAAVVVGAIAIIFGIKWAVKKSAGGAAAPAPTPTPAPTPVAAK